jgi:predicted RNA-binding Zn ribbon-like protein
MSDKKKSAGNLKEVLGRRLCLDFINTLSWRGRQKPEELLNTYGDLVVWGQYVNILTDQDVEMLTRQAERHPSESKKAINSAIELREVIYSIFSSIAEGTAIPEKDLSMFNKYLSKVMMRSQIIETEDGFSWETGGDKNKLYWILNPIVRSAAELLVSDEARKVKECGDNACGWLFLDSSRNQSRRWCAMKDCGNRAKARRFYKRKKCQNDSQF